MAPGIRDSNSKPLVKEVATLSVGIDDPNTIGADHPDSSLLGKTPEFFLFSGPFSHLGISRTEKNDESIPFFGTLLECFQHQLDEEFRSGPSPRAQE